MNKDIEKKKKSDKNVCSKFEALNEVISLNFWSLKKTAIKKHLPYMYTTTENTLSTLKMFLLWYQEHLFGILWYWRECLTYTQKNNQD